MDYEKPPSRCTRRSTKCDGRAARWQAAFGRAPGHARLTNGKTNYFFKFDVERKVSNRYGVRRVARRFEKPPTSNLKRCDSRKKRHGAKAPYRCAEAGPSSARAERSEEPARGGAGAPRGHELGAGAPSEVARSRPCRRHTPATAKLTKTRRAKATRATRVERRTKPKAEREAERREATTQDDRDDRDDRLRVDDRDDRDDRDAVLPRVATERR